MRVASNDDIAVASVNDCLASLKKIRGVGSGEKRVSLKKEPRFWTKISEIIIYGDKI